MENQNGFQSAARNIEIECVDDAERDTDSNAKSVKRSKTRLSSRKKRRWKSMKSSNGVVSGIENDDKGNSQSPEV